MSWSENPTEGVCEKYKGLSLSLNPMKRCKEQTGHRMIQFLAPSGLAVDGTKGHSISFAAEELDSDLRSLLISLNCITPNSAKKILKIDLIDPSEKLRNLYIQTHHLKISPYLEKRKEDSVQNLRTTGPRKQTSPFR